MCSTEQNHTSAAAASLIYLLSYVDEVIISSMNQHNFVVVI